jgi:hypothetical protein
MPGSAPPLEMIWALPFKGRLSVLCTISGHLIKWGDPDSFVEFLKSCGTDAGMIKSNEPFLMNYDLTAFLM